MGEFFVYSCFFGILLLFFPIFVYLDVFLDVAENKCWFAVSLFKLKIFGGYAQVCSKGFAIHITKKTAILVEFKDMKATRQKFEVTKGFQLYRFHQIVEVSGATQPYGALVAAAIQSVSAQAFSVLQTQHPFLSLKNSTLLTEKPCLKVTFQTIFVFNLLILSIAITKKILEATIKWIRRKKSTASWKRQPSN